MPWRSACAVLIFVALALIESCALRPERPLDAAGSEQTAAGQEPMAGSAPVSSDPKTSERPLDAAESEQTAAAQQSMAGSAPVSSDPQAEIRKAKSSFESSIRPVLATRCAPCHEPGGKMYERLPFDDPTTVSSHADAIRGRLKGEDREALERWLESLPASPGVE